MTSEYADPFAGGCAYTFHVDIGDQEPSLGCDPKCLESPVLTGINWLGLDMSESAVHSVKAKTNWGMFPW